MLNPISFKAHSGRNGARLHRADRRVNIIQAVRPTKSAAANRPAKMGQPAARRPRVFLALAALLALTLALALAACGTGTAIQTTATTRAVTTTTTAETTPAGQPGTTGGTINVKIDASKAREMLKSNPNAILLDVRTVEENREKRIPGSTLIPIQDLPNRLNELPKDPNRPILVYCRSGNRSAQAAAILSKAGFPAVYDFGGIIDWPYETEQG